MKIDHSGKIVASSCGDVIDISRLPRAIASSSVPCLNSVAFQCRFELREIRDGRAEHLLSATARWSVAVAGEESRA